MSRAPQSTDPLRRPSSSSVEATDGVAGAEAFLGSGVDRRTVFRRVGMAALIGGGSVALAACSGSNSSSTGPASSAAAPASSAAAPTSAASSSEPTPSESASSASSASSTPSEAPSPSGPTADAAHTVPKSDVPEGGGKVGSDFVITQPTAGSFKAFSNVCTHLGCALTSVANGTMNCPCHGSQFSITDGSVKAGPAPKPLPSKTVTASGSDLLVGL